MTAFRHIWDDRALQIVANNFTRLGPKGTRELVIEHCKKRMETEGRYTYQIPSLRGVIWQAHAMGLISDDFRDQLNEMTYRKSISLKQRKRILERDGEKCLNCGRSSDIQVDHIVPVFDGGKNDDDNLQVLCKTCHKVKGLSTINIREMYFRMKEATRIHKKEDGVYIEFDKSLTETEIALLGERLKAKGYEQAR